MANLTALTQLYLDSNQLTGARRPRGWGRGDNWAQIHVTGVRAESACAVCTQLVRAVVGAVACGCGHVCGSECVVCTRRPRWVRLCVFMYACAYACGWQWRVRV